VLFKRNSFKETLSIKIIPAPIVRTVRIRSFPLCPRGLRYNKLKNSQENNFMDGTRRADIKKGLRVSIVLKKDQQTGKLTEGIVKDILTNSPAHPHGIKVRLQSGEIGRVKKISV